MFVVLRWCLYLLLCCFSPPQKRDMEVNEHHTELSVCSSRNKTGSLSSLAFCFFLPGRGLCCEHFPPHRPPFPPAAHPLYPWFYVVLRAQHATWSLIPEAIFFFISAFFSLGRSLFKNTPSVQTSVGSAGWRSSSRFSR